MRILYFTDLHGDYKKYDAIMSLTEKHEANIVINGGDMLPKGGDPYCDQSRFIADYLDNHFNLFNNKEIHYLNCLGNDDLRIYDNLFDQVCSKYPFVTNISQKKIKIDGFEFIGMNWVVDYPFRLKDRCRIDNQEYQFEKQFGTGLLSSNFGYQEIEDWFSYAKSLPSIDDELKGLPVPNNPNKTVYIIHMPPSRLGLDKCSHGAEVGSVAVFDFIEEQQPLFTLHGHIHESPAMTGKWFNKIDKTICIQPGQSDKMAYVVIDLENNSFERFTLNI